MFGLKPGPIQETRTTVWMFGLKPGPIQETRTTVWMFGLKPGPIQETRTTVWMFGLKPGPIQETRTTATRCAYTVFRQALRKFGPPRFRLRGAGTEYISRGLKPEILAGLDVRAEARTYPRNKNYSLDVRAEARTYLRNKNKGKSSCALPEYLEQVLGVRGRRRAAPPFLWAFARLCVILA